MLPQRCENITTKVSTGMLPVLAHNLMPGDFTVQHFVSDLIQWLSRAVHLLLISGQPAVIPATALWTAQDKLRRT